MACDIMALTGSTVSYISWMHSTTQAPASLPPYHHNVQPIPALHSASQKSTGYHHLTRTVSIVFSKVGFGGVCDKRTRLSNGIAAFCGATTLL